MVEMRMSGLKTVERKWLVEKKKLEWKKVEKKEQLMKMEIETVLLWWKALEKYLELKMEKTSLKAQLMEYDSHHMEYRSSMDHKIHHRQPTD